MWPLSFLSAVAAVNVTVPAFLSVTVPFASTSAIALLLLVHVTASSAGCTSALRLTASVRSTVRIRPVTTSPFISTSTRFAIFGVTVMRHEVLAPVAFTVAMTCISTSTAAGCTFRLPLAFMLAYGAEARADAPHNGLICKSSIRLHIGLERHAFTAGDDIRGIQYLYAVGISDELERHARGLIAAVRGLCRQVTLPVLPLKPYTLTLPPLTSYSAYTFFVSLTVHWMFFFASAGKVTASTVSASAVPLRSTLYAVPLRGFAVHLKGHGIHLRHYPDIGAGLTRAVLCTGDDLYLHRVSYCLCRQLACGCDRGIGRVLIRDAPYDGVRLRAAQHLRLELYALPADEGRHQE